ARLSPRAPGAADHRRHDRVPHGPRGLDLPQDPPRDGHRRAYGGRGGSAVQRIELGHQPGAAVLPPGGPEADLLRTRLISAPLNDRDACLMSTQPNTLTDGPMIGPPERPSRRRRPRLRAVLIAGAVLAILLVFHRPLLTRFALLFRV